jgi:hypothetical protein
MSSALPLCNANAFKERGCPLVAAGIVCRPYYHSVVIVSVFSHAFPNIDYSFFLHLYFRLIGAALGADPWKNSVAQAALPSNSKSGIPAPKFPLPIEFFIRGNCRLITGLRPVYHCAGFAAQQAPWKVFSQGSISWKMAFSVASLGVFFVYCGVPPRAVPWKGHFLLLQFEGELARHRPLQT